METKLEKFERQLLEVNGLVFRYRVKARRNGLNEAERLLFRKLTTKQRSLKNVVKSLTKK